MTVRLSIPIPADEDERVGDLERLGTLLAEPDAVLDAVTHELARIFAVPSAAISFIDRDTQHYKSAVGIPEPFASTRVEPRDISICSFVVGDNDMLVVEDLAADDRFRESIAVTGYGLRFYAGAPLRAESGRAVGSMCILDRRPRSITDREREMLRLVAEGVMAQVRLQAASQQVFEHTRRIEEEIRRAVDVQRFLLPPARVEASGWVIRHRYRPMAQLGGDFVDVVTGTAGRVAVIVADVSGHGTDAALMAAMVKTAFARAVDRSARASDILGSMNRELSAVAPPGQFVSAVTAVLEPHTGAVEVGTAGHPPPMVVAPGSAEPVATGGNALLAIDLGGSYDHASVLTLGEGERLLLFTDGAFEAVAATGGPEAGQLGLDGLGRFARDAARSDGEGEGFLDGLLQRIDRFAGGLAHDDVALMELMRSPPTPGR